MIRWRQGWPAPSSVAIVVGSLPFSPPESSTLGAWIL